MLAGKAAEEGIITTAGLSDQGLLRLQNEDHWHADAEQGVFIVSDGMGGRVAGEVASRIVIEVFPSYIMQQLGDLHDLSSPAAIGIVHATLVELSDLIYKESSKRPDFFGMGATLVLALIRKAYALIAHVGDSRFYLWRQEQLIRLTKDHSLVQTLIDLGQISLEEAANHPARSQITQFIGMSDQIVPEIQGLVLHSGDRLLLCTDGLTGMVPDDSIAEILHAHPLPEQACLQLIAAANAAGGKDNITVVIVDWVGGA
jgi:PPM family protein phosphatase